MIRAAAIGLVAGLTACGDGVEAPPPPADLDAPGRVADGRDLFLEHCALCHGEQADGQGQRASHFETPPRDFTRPGWRDELPPRHLYAVIRHGRQGTPMPAWNWLDEEQIWSLVGYLRSVPESQP